MKHFEVNNIGHWVFSLLCLLTSVQIFLIVLTNYDQPVSFDGAMNLQVSQSLADGGTYARFYNEWRYFPEEIQTNAPFVVPAAAVYSLFGVSYITSQAVSIAYLFLFLVSVFFLVKPVGGNLFAVLAIAFIVLMPEFSSFSLNGYGEIPALFWCLTALGFVSAGLNKASNILFLMAGICFGLSVLTKTVMLMPVAVSLAVYFVFSISDRSFKRFFIIVIGIVSVLALNELWKLLVLGFVEWLDWWGSQIKAITAQAGVTSAFGDTHNPLQKLMVHGTILQRSVQLSFPSFYLLCLIPLMVLILMIKIQFQAEPEVDRRTVFVVAVLFAMVAAYFSWWLLFTPTEKAWYRRIFNGWILLLVLLPVVMAFVFKFKDTILLRFSKVALLFPLLLVVWSSIQGFDHSVNDVRKDSIEKVVQFVADQPDSSKFYGFSWYSAPVVSLYAGEPIYDLAIEKYSIKQDGIDRYLLADAGLSASSQLEIALWGFEYSTPVEGSDWANAFKLESNFILPSATFQDESILQSRVDFIEQNYTAVQGFNEPEGDGWRWASPRSAVILLAEYEVQELMLNGYLPSFEQYHPMQQQYFRISALIDDCELDSKNLYKSGQFTVVWDISHCHKSENRIMKIEFSTDHMLDIDFKALSWIIRSVEVR